MSFLDKNYSENIATRLTQKGRESIANGNFVISYFAVGDSEYSYTGSTSGQTIMAPFDDYGNVKYPLSYVSGSSPYGIPYSTMITEECSNIMGSAGFVSSSYGPDTSITPYITSNYETTSLISGDTITINNTGYTIDSFITLAFNPDKLNDDVITGNTNSLVYKIVDINGSNLTLDRNIPTLITGDVVVIQNDVEFPLSDCSTDQNDSWTLNVVWDKNPIGYNTSFTDYTGNGYIGAKEFFGYKTSKGQVDNTGTIITNTLIESIIISPEEQKVIGILHYSKNGDLIDPNRFFKYDDHISINNDTPSSDCDDNENSMLDSDYFRVHIPFLLYHRNTGSTIGATFHMDSEPKEIVSPYNSRFTLNYRDLLDENNFRVGKVFYNQQVIVFDDEEIVAALDYKSNRRYTLPAPKVSSIITNDPIEDLTTGKTMWVTYMLKYSDDNSINGLPCNYFTKVTGSTTPHSISVKFGNNDFNFLQTTTGNTINGFIADELLIIFQITNNDELPEYDGWFVYSGITGGGLINESQLSGQTFTINNSDVLDGYNNQFNLSNHMDNMSSEFYFGDEQPFAGSVNVVRATEIQRLTFNVNLPSDKFNISQNPTFTSGSTVMITEVALLNSNKDALVMGKMSSPLARNMGTQIIPVQLDF
jgi:hypothetical protein